jgi:putative SOS response-associated peptidase YedK
MCGRFTLQPTETFYERFQITNRLDSLRARYNIAPGQMVPVIIANNPRQIVLMRWGLIPHWAKDEKTAYRRINVRVETLTQRPAFPGLLSHSRSLVPACGFYEWKAEERDKTPYYIHPQEDQHIAFAGLYDVWQHPDGEAPYSSDFSGA